MKKIITVLVVLGLWCSVGFAVEPENIVAARNRLINYYETGEYQADIDKVVWRAKNYLEGKIHNNSSVNKKLAIVLDIDETCLSGYEYWKALSFGGTYKEIDDAIKEGKEKVFPSVLELYNYAKEKKVAVFFVTSRPENERDVTITNLRDVGFKNWDGLYLRPIDYKTKYKSVVPYKAATRKQIMAQGYDIVLNIGDQYSDLQGGYAEQAYKLPNPYYYLP